MKWHARYYIGLGLGLIALVNLTSLSSVIYNRSGVAESQIVLSEHELRPLRHSSFADNSRLSLFLEWRIDQDEQDLPYSRQSKLLSAQQVQALGLSIASDCADNCRLPPSLEVFAVFALSQAAPKPPPKDEMFYASPSRLQLLDLSLDLPSLRAHYPDRQRYLILRAQAKPVNHSDQGLEVYLELSNNSINVPTQWQKALSRIGSCKKQPDQAPHYQIEISVGQRLEPWVSKVNVDPSCR